MANRTFAGPSYIQDGALTVGSDPKRKTTTPFYNGSGSDLAANVAVFIDETDNTHGLGSSITISAAGALGADAPKFVGITDQAIPDGEWGNVVTSGVVLAEVAAGVAADEPLTIDHTTDGHLEGATIGTHHVVATALEAIGATVAGQAAVRVHPTF